MKGKISMQVNDLLNKDIIQSSTSSFNLPIWIVPKKANSHGEKKVVDGHRLPQVERENRQGRIPATEYY